MCFISLLGWSLELLLAAGLMLGLESPKQGFIKQKPKRGRDQYNPSIISFLVPLSPRIFFQVGPLCLLEISEVWHPKSEAFLPV